MADHPAGAERDATSARPGHPDSGPTASLTDIEEAARGMIPAAVHDFVYGGAGAELTLAHNRAALDSLHLVPRLFVDVSQVRHETTLPGGTARLPVVLAPMAYQRLLHPDGELAAARAAVDAGVPFTVSTLSSYPVEQIAQIGGTTWFQLYLMRDRGRSRELVARAEAAGCQVLILTADVPRMGRRLRDVRNGFRLDPGVVAANLNEGARSRGHAGQPGVSAVAAHTDALFHPGPTWADLAWLRELTSLPLLVKGVLHPEDAIRCVETGADGVIVSNHGGRQFDGAVASITALPAVAEAVGDRAAVLFDSGVRSGLDVVKAIALGARAVLIGRPVLWGLAVAGEAGVTTVLSLLSEELDCAMALAGCPDLEAVRNLSTRSVQRCEGRPADNAWGTP